MTEFSFGENCPFKIGKALKMTMCQWKHQKDFSDKSNAVLMSPVRLAV